MNARRLAPAALLALAAALAPAPAAAAPPAPAATAPPAPAAAAPSTPAAAAPRANASGQGPEPPRPRRDPGREPAGPPAEGEAGATAVPPLPVVALPPPLEVGRAPDGLSWSYEVEGLRVVGPDGERPDRSPSLRGLRRAPGAGARGRKLAPAPRRGAADAEWVRIEGASAPSLIAFAWRAPHSNFARSLALPCRPWLGAPVRWPLRWEALRGDADDAPIWQVNDGWYDESTCQVSVERRTALRPAVLAWQGHAPALLAAREGDAIVFLAGPTRSLAAHDLAGAARATPGPFARVSVPVGPGQASSLVAAFVPGALASWWGRLDARAPGPPPGPAGAGAKLLEVRVDVSQTVGEREPTLAIQRLTDGGDGPPTSGFGTLSASDAEAMRSLTATSKARR